MNIFGGELVSLLASKPGRLTLSSGTSLEVSDKLRNKEIDISLSTDPLTCLLYTSSPELGYLGYFENGRPVFYKATTRKHTIDTEFDVSNLNDLPRVDIIYSHVNDDGRMAEAAVANGAKGIVHAGTGNG